MYVNQTALGFHQVFKFGCCLSTKKLIQTHVATHNFAVCLGCAYSCDFGAIELLTAQMHLMKLTVVSSKLQYLMNISQNQ